MELRISIIVGSILLITAIVSFSSCGSTPSPRIKQYECTGNYELVISKISKFCSGRHDVKFEGPDRIVDQNNRYAEYAIVTLVAAGDSTQYGLKFEANPSKPNSTIISMVEGDDKTTE